MPGPTGWAGCVGGEACTSRASVDPRRSPTMCTTSPARSSRIEPLSDGSWVLFGASALDRASAAVCRSSVSDVRRGPNLDDLQVLIPEGELRVLRHLVRGPGRREGHRRDDLLDAVELGDELDDLLGDLRPDRARGRGEGEGHVDTAAGDLDAVDEAELDEVEPQLRVDDVAQRLGDFLFVDHRVE